MVEHKLRGDGALVWWECGPTNRLKLVAQMDAIGLSKFVPPARSIQSSIRLAMSELADNLSHARGNRAKKEEGSDEKFKQSYKVESHIDPKVDGFELVDVYRKKTNNRYDGLFSCKVVLKDGEERVDCGYGDGYAHRGRLQEHYEELRQDIDGSAIGASLVELLTEFHGTCVRASGGNYYIPEAGVSKWDEVVKAYAAANAGNKVHRVRVALDEEGIASIKAAIEKELLEEAGKIAEELRGGDLSDTAIQKRIDSAAEMRKKCSLYEGILQTELSTCRQMLTLAETAVSSGVAVQEGEDVFAGVIG